MCTGPRKLDNKGSMPFALVAIAILLIATSHYAVTESLRDDGEALDDAGADLNILGNSAYTVESFVEKGLAEILFDICTSPDAGTVSERGEAFRERADIWMKSQFPFRQSGVTVELRSYTLEVRSERFQVSEGFETNGYTPAFLKVEGTVTAAYSSEAGKTVKTFAFSTDGSCALPLVVEMGSLFENAMSDGGASLFQMVKYQLTSLAQYRVINGYGALYEFGEKGTNSILTAKDVEDAYRNAVNALRCIYFRDDCENTVTGDVDLANSIVSDGNIITIDINAIYAQALSAKVDDIVLKWFDYFLGNKILNICDHVTDTLKNAWGSLTSFLTGKNNFSAAPYIREVVGNIDTKLRTGEKFSFEIIDPDTSETYQYEVEYPRVDLYGSSIIKNFKSNYNKDTNNIRDWLYNIVNTTILKIAEGKGMSAVEIPLDDDTPFAETLTEGIRMAAQGKAKTFEDTAYSVIDSGSVPDQFYAAIYASISDNRDRLFCYSELSFRENIIKQIRGAVIRDLSTDDHTLTQDEADLLICEAFGRYAEIYSAYRSEVDALLYKLDNLNRVADSHKSVAELGCIAILKAGFLKIDDVVDYKKVAENMCSEYIRNININPYSGLIDLPEESVFTLSHESQILTEKVMIAEHSAPIVSVGRASSSSTHETGFDESAYAAYCTVFPVTIRDEFTLDVRSAGNILYSLGMCDSAYHCSVPVDLSMEIAVVSGWGLIGVEYEASATIISDVIQIFLKALEPLLEPLRKIMEMAESVMEILSQAVRMLAHYMTEYLEMIYNILMKPLEIIGDLFQRNVTDVFCEQLIELTENATAIIDISLVGQTLGFSYMGYTVKFTFNIATLEKYTKNIVKAEFEGNVAGSAVTAFINVKTKGETKKTVYVNGGFTIKGKDWDLSGTIDPKMAYGKHLITLGGTVFGIRIDATLPEAVQYNHIGIALSDIPGLGEALSSIPSPVPGTKMEIDAGIDLKYSIPIVTGVLINEFESNPEGTDADHEWAEILNLTGSRVDLNNWTITTSKNKVQIIKDVELGPGERTVIHFPGTFLLNSKEYLILKDPDGAEVDRSATMSDSYNDSRTCQRGMDGSTEWAVIPGTCGESNRGGLLGEDGMAVRVIKDIVSKAALKAMNEMKHVTTPEALQELLTRTVLYAVDDGINRIANCLVEGSVYLVVDLTDVSSSAHYGYKMYVMADKELVGDILKYLLGKVEALFLSIDDPYNIDIDNVLYEDVYFGMSTCASVNAPSILCASKEYAEKVTLASDIACNLSALGGLFDCDMGKQKVRSQIGITNCPYELMPKALGLKKNMTYDYWFLRIVFSW